MATVFSRKAINSIVGDENLTPEEKVERIFAAYGQALDDGYIAKSAAQAAQAAAVEAARADAVKDFKAPDVKESEEYKSLVSQYEAYKTMQAARTSADYANVKPKFFETVYGMVDKADGAKPVAEQLSEIAGKYEEYFAEQEPSKPSFGAETRGSMPTGKPGPSFMDTWGFIPKKP